LTANLADNSSKQRPNKSCGTARATKSPGDNATGCGVHRLRGHDNRRIGALSATVLLLARCAFGAAAYIFGSIIAREDLERMIVDVCHDLDRRRIEFAPFSKLVAIAANKNRVRIRQVGNAVRRCLAATRG